jgi:cyclophilin family peptidyl-prolyl cis-trans isomerase
MPKTTKRSEARRASKIARAHSTQFEKADVNSPEPQRKGPGYKPPARGIARYPWATIILFVLVVGCAVLLMYTNHLGPFAPPATAAKHKATPTPVATKTANTASPCLSTSIVSAITKTGAGPTASEVAKINHTYSQAQNVVDDNKIYCAGINTNRGLIVVELDPKLAPKTVNNFVFLAQNHFYDGLTFHRVVKGFVAQGGDPTGTGNGGPGYKFADEPVQGNYTAGTVAMANSGVNTNGSQFFIDLVDNSKQLQKQYNLFGHVVQGMDVAQKLTVTGSGIKPDYMTYVIVKPAS